ncbi:MAG: hypothetical protein KDB39_15375 [Austwickia sp.]|nr:hypothetical protein [Austwickia sp.]
MDREEEEQGLSTAHDDGDAALVRVARRLGATFDSGTAISLLHVIRESDLPQAIEVDRRFDELMSVIGEAAPPDGGTGSAQASGVIAEPVPQDRSKQAAEGEPTAVVDDVVAGLAEIGALQEAATELADLLAESSQRVREGELPPPVLQPLTDWVSRAEAVLGGRKSLAARALDLKEEIDRRAEAAAHEALRAKQLRLLRGVADAVRTLEDSGFGAQAINLVTPHGFTSLEEFSEALGDLAASTVSDSDDTGGQHVPPSGEAEPNVAQSGSGREGDADVARVSSPDPAPAGRGSGEVDDAPEPVILEADEPKDAGEIDRDRQASGREQLTGERYIPDGGAVSPPRAEERLPGAAAAKRITPAAQVEAAPETEPEPATEPTGDGHGDLEHASPPTATPIPAVAPEADGAVGPTEAAHATDADLEPASRPPAPQSADDDADPYRPQLGPGEQLPADPWVEPATSPLIASLIQERDELAAVLVAEHREPEAPRVKALRFFAASFAAAGDSLQVSLPALVPSSEEVAMLRPDELRIFLAAAVKAALELGYSLSGSLDPIRERAGLQTHPAAPLLEELCHLSERGYRQQTASAAPATGLPERWARLASDCQVLASALKTRTISYQRASKVLHYLARDEEPLGRALRKLETLAEEQVAGRPAAGDAGPRLLDLSRDLTDPVDRTHLLTAADAAVSSSQQRRKQIVGPSLARLNASVDEVVVLISQATELLALAREASANGAQAEGEELDRLLRELPTFESDSVGNAALSRLVEWLRDGDAAVRSPAPSLEVLLDRRLLPLHWIPRDAMGVLERRPTEDDLARLLDDDVPMRIVEGYLNCGNLVAAEKYLTAFNVIRTDEMDDEFLRAGRRLSERHQQALIAADRVVARLRALSDDELARALAARIEDQRSPLPERFDLALQALSAITVQGRELLGSVRTTLFSRAAAVGNDAVAGRIRALIESEDEPLAVEYLNLAEAGEALPKVEPPPGDDFADFFPRVVEVAARGDQSGHGILTSIRRSLGAPAAPGNRMMAAGMAAWLELGDRRMGEPQMSGRRIADILRMLGLVPRADNWLQEITSTRRAGYASYEVVASPLDRSYVPSLGTQAHGRYDVTLVFETFSPQRLLQFVDEDRRNRASVILYFGVLTSKQRYELRKLTARAEFSPLVIDHAVVGWLSTLDEPGWRKTQRVTLPFTTINPYTPFAGGEVPDEVFVGREAERRAITTPTGSMFVYGGRQLGKSALLRRVERGFSGGRGVPRGAVSDRVAVYIDLKSAGIGESTGPEGLWPTLADRLIRKNVLVARRKPWTVETVPPAVLEWLEADPGRTLLLLLDEADNFLTADSRATGPQQVGGFPTLQRLKGLMEQSNRRFKAVFAGLHQVQRFHGLPNTPVAHGGQDILVGPLNPVDARQLVQDPLHALGYTFETPETMWRLLLITNYQASLIQIICHQLLLHLRDRNPPEDGRRLVITNKHVDEVYARPDVRDLIATRFRWTINLDPRYQVIALVTALRSYDTDPGGVFTASELQDECAYFWADGFDRRTLSSSEFARYLDEMTGLGVLHRRGEGFGLRSPSIRGLLGTRESIESELLEAAETLTVERGYNPTMTRRVIDSRSEQRSPMPDSDLATLREPGCHVVVGSRALGIDRVHRALQMVADEVGRELHRMETDQLQDALRRRSKAIYVVSYLPGSSPDLPRLIEQTERAGITLVVVLTPDEFSQLEADDPHVVQLRRWSMEALQSWPETPFSAPALRVRLKRVTGGWPDLVERVVADVSAGTTLDAAISSIAESLSSPELAEAFLAGVGIDLAVARRWVEWFGHLDEEDGLVASMPATLQDLDTAGFNGRTQDLIERLALLDVLDETADGWVLDRAVTAAVSALPPS